MFSFITHTQTFTSKLNNEKWEKNSVFRPPHFSPLNPPIAEGIINDWPRSEGMSFLNHRWSELIKQVLPFPWLFFRKVSSVIEWKIDVYMTFYSIQQVTATLISRMSLFCVKIKLSKIPDFFPADILLNCYEPVLFPLANIENP